MRRIALGRRRRASRLPSRRPRLPRRVRTPDGRQIRWIDATGVGANAGLRYRAVARSSAAAAARSQAWGVNGWIEPRS